MSNDLTVTPDNDAALKNLGSLVINSIKQAFDGRFQKKPCQPAGLTPVNLWCRKLNRGDRLPRGRSFAGKSAGKVVSLFFYDDLDYYKQ